MKIITQFLGIRVLKEFAYKAQTRNEKGATLYPVIYGKNPQTDRPYVKQIHKIIMPVAPRGYVIDHVNGDTFDNRKSNLEVVTRAENTRRAQIKKVG